MKTGKKLLIVLFGTLVMAISMVFFYAPSNIAAGGVSGIAVIINYIFPFLDLGIIILIMNIILFVVGFIVLGKEFGLLTLYGSVTYSLWITILDNIFRLEKPIVDDLLVNVLFGSILTGIGMAFIYNQNASSGGTDILAKMINHYTHIDLGKSGLIVDAFIVVGAMAFISIEIGLYSFIGILLSSYFIDYLIAGFNVKIEMTIISSKIPEINRYIIEYLDRSSTIYKSIGGYSKDNRNTLKTIVDKREYFMIKNYINEVDANAFVYITNVSEVIGEGFTREKK